jgi:hypothetical protein
LGYVDHDVVHYLHVIAVMSLFMFGYVAEDANVITYDEEYLCVHA